MTALRSARSVLSKGIKAASGTYAEKIQGHTRWMWQGVQALRDYKSSQGVNDNDASLPDRLNNFFAQFEAPNPITRGRAVPSPPSIRPALTINAADTHRTLTSVNPRKAGGPDNIPVHVLRTCAGELADVLPHILSISLSQAIVPRCFKTSTIIPVAKKSAVSCLNDYRPVTLIVMKCFERFVKPHITASLSASHDPYQFAYHPNRSTEDAISTTLQSVITHLDQKETYARILYIDFSPAFNTIIPQKLMEKLLLLGLNAATCLWIQDFLTQRPQSVRVRNNTSNSITLSTASPQGCVLSPLLLTLLTRLCIQT